LPPLIARLAQVFAKRKKSDAYKLKMLFGKGDADDGDAEDDPQYYMGEGDLPAKKNKPNHIKNHLEGTATFTIHHLLAKGSQGDKTVFDGLQAERDANDGDKKN
jgi:hypothetical protein